MKLAFLDTETTGLDPERHEIWEVGLILRELDDEGNRASSDDEYLWQLPVNLATADLIALNIGRFHERRLPLTGEGVTNRLIAGDGDSPGYRLPTASLGAWASRFADLTWGAHIVGAVPSFDAQRLERLLRQNGACPGWHYHLIDIEAMIVGYQIGRWAQAKIDASVTGNKVEVGPFRHKLPWSSDQLSEAVGIDPAKYTRHSALGDARQVRDLFDRVAAP